MSTIRSSFLALALLATAPWSSSARGLQVKPSPPNAKGPAAVLAAREDNKNQAPGKKPRGKFTISKETTYVTCPLDKDGYIDFVAALNERLRLGVTPANNANVLLWKALGPHPRGEKMPAEFFQWLGIPEPPEKGEYFIDLSRHMKDELQIDPGEGADEIHQQLDRTMQWPWTAQEHPHIASWLKANEKSLALVVEATRRSHYFSPLVPAKKEKESSGLLSAALSGVHKCRDLAKALAARALLRAGQGAVDDAWQDLLACHRLGRLVGRGGTLIEGLASIAIDNIASKADLAFLDRARPNAKRIENCLRDLQKLPQLPDMAEQVSLGERFMFLDAAQTMAREGIEYMESLLGVEEAKKLNTAVGGIPIGIDWDSALRIGNRWYDRLAGAMRDKDRGSRAKKIEDIDAEQETLKEEVEGWRKELAAFISRGKQPFKAKDKAIGEILGKAIGNDLIGLFLPSGREQQAVERTEQVYHNVCLAFALAWYQRDHGRYPKELNALAPKYLAQIPRDLFSGKSLICRPSKDGYLLYSVGVNGKDDGGRGYEETPPGDDLNVRMPLPEARRK